MPRPIRIAALASTFLIGAGSVALAQESAPDLPKANLSVVGSWSSNTYYQDFERPFWTETIPTNSNGSISVEMTTFDQMGVAGSDVFRLLGNGVFDVGMTISDYVVSDAPELEGLDVPLVAETSEEARAMIEAAEPMVADIMEQRFDAKLLAIAPESPQVVFCNTEIDGLSGLKGLKVRGSGRLTTEFLNALGAEGVNISFSEVPAALERGVIDCAVTGAGSGYSAGWPEVTSHLLWLPIGGLDPIITAMNMDKWNSLGKETQTFIQKQIDEHFIPAVWKDHEEAKQTDLKCLTSSDECSRGEPAGMTEVEVDESDREIARRVLEEQVLPAWAARTGGEWVQRWNASVGQTVGLTAKGE